MLPGEVGTDINYYPVGDWSPTVNFNKVMAVYSVEDNESNHLEHQLVVRTANDVRSPNLWLSLPAGANATTNLMMQFGLAVRKRAAATGNPRAVIRVMVVGSWV
jgi:hypothetical protein